MRTGGRNSYTTLQHDQYHSDFFTTGRRKVEEQKHFHMNKRELNEIFCDIDAHLPVDKDVKRNFKV